MAAVTIRPAGTEDAPAVAEVWLRARRAAVPAIPAPVHDDDEFREWVATVLLPQRSTWVAVVEGRVLAMMTAGDGWIDQLYVDPFVQSRGIGTLLVGRAKELCPEGLDLWTFQANTGARRFYARHGFIAVETTDGDNEEGAPDVRYRWEGERRA